MNACPDWLLKRRLSFAIHLRVTHTGFAPEHFVIVAISVNSSRCLGLIPWSALDLTKETKNQYNNT